MISTKKLKELDRQVIEMYKFNIRERDREKEVSVYYALGICQDYITPYTIKSLMCSMQHLYKRDLESIRFYYDREDRGLRLLAKAIYTKEEYLKLPKE